MVRLSVCYSKQVQFTVKPMQTPIDAVRLLGDLLEEKEQELSVCSNERDSEALQGLWEVYNSLLEA